MVTLLIEKKSLECRCNKLEYTMLFNVCGSDISGTFQFNHEFLHTHIRSLLIVSVIKLKLHYILIPVLQRDIVNIYMNMT